MVAVRVRHPAGTSTLDIDQHTQTVDDLRILLFSVTGIAPDEQEIKFGYPPKPLPNSTGTLASVPIARGEQLIVAAGKPSRGSPGGSLGAPESTPTAQPVSASKPLGAAPPVAAPAPAPAPAPVPDSPLQQNDIPLEGAESVALPGRDAGYLQLRVVPDDNSCLFSAIGVVFEGGIQSAQKLRRVVADAIRDDPESYPDVVLGQPRDTYVRKVLEKDTWGGAIELAIFAKHYQTEISSFDVATGRCDRFGQDEYGSRCILVYSGIHYDAVSLSPLPVSPPSFHTTVFPVTDTTILPTADQLISQLRARHYYTDTATFDLKCNVCGTGLKGEKGAREHASQTGHVSFGEY